MNAVKEAAIKLIQSLPEHCTFDLIREQMEAVATQGALATFAARALTVANERARALGLDLRRLVVSIVAEGGPTDRIWRVRYGPLVAHDRRGGDLMVFVDEATWAVQRVMRGQ